MRNPLAFAAIAAFVPLFVSAALAADATQPTAIDLTRPPPALLTGHLKLGGKNPDGVEINVNNQYLTLDGKPFLPVMGEMHYTRYPADQWEPELLKMKAGGINVVSTYIFWIHHEEVEGQWNWTGNHDLRKFIQLAAAHGLKVYIRVGPWDHGECRNGGIPEWMLDKTKNLRSEDPVFMGYVRTLYDQIAAQVQGLLWKDGGPIIGTQIENEYHGRPAYLLALKNLAKQAGIDTPLYSVTGWDRARFPQDEFLPVFGGYPDGFWYHEAGYAQNGRKQYFFTRILDDAAMTNNMKLAPNAPSLSLLNRYPNLDAEIGGGMAIAYARRPLMSTSDIVAATLTKLGSGSNLLGYYMYHGGHNPTGQLHTLQESQLTRLTNDNDLTIFNYDFQAPLGEYGQERPSYGALRLMHAFVTDFGASLATMPAYFPPQMPTGLGDAKTLRWTVRTDGKSGFIFINNYQRGLKMSEQSVQLSLNLADGTRTIPASPVEFGSGSYAIWPFNLDLGGPVLQYSTAQLLCRLDVQGAPCFVFFAPHGVDPELALDSRTVVSIDGPLGSREDTGGQIILRKLTPGTDCLLTLKSALGQESRILLLTEVQARQCLKTNIWGADRLLMSADEVIPDGQSVELRSRDPQMALEVFPNDETGRLGDSRPDGVFTSYAVQAQPKQVQVQVSQVKAAGIAPKFVLGVHHTPLPPDDAAFDKVAGVWHIDIPPTALDGTSEVFLRIDYAGDAARAYVGDELIDDQFYYGPTWEIGLSRYAPDVLQKGITLKIMPLAADDPVYIDPAFRLKPGADGQSLALSGVRAQSEYRTRVSLDRQP
jgi:beta-galactosidase